MPQRRQSENCALLCIFLLWLGLQVSFILYTGNSLGGDVWAYAKSAQVFHETGRLMIPDRSPQSLIFLTIWSGLFTKVFGFSFLTLNFAVLVLSVIGVIFFVLVLQEVAPESSMLLPLTAYLFNPIFFAVAGGYLTDAPFVSLLLLAMYFFIRAYRRESVAWALSGSLVIGCAFLVRQYGILLVVAAAVPFFMPKAPRQRQKRVALVTATLAPTFVMVILFFLWLQFKHGVPSEFRVYQLEFLNVPRVLWSVLGVPFFGGLYMGLFLSPLLLRRIFQRSREEKWLWVFYSLLLAGVAVILAVRGRPLPYMWNNVMPYWGSILLMPAGRAEIIREKGTTRSRFFRGELDKYTWVDVGSSYLPSELQAAFLYAQLEAREQIQVKRRRVWDYYYAQLKEWADDHDVHLPVVPARCEQPYHFFHLLMPSLGERQALIAHLKARGILSVFHYLPLHLSEMGNQFGGRPGDCPVTEDVSDQLLRLPFYNDLTEADQAYVVAAMKEFDEWE